MKNDVLTIDSTDLARGIEPGYAYSNTPIRKGNFGFSGGNACFSRPFYQGQVSSMCPQTEIFTAVDKGRVYAGTELNGDVYYWTTRGVLYKESTIVGNPLGAGANLDPTRLGDCITTYINSSNYGNPAGTYIETVLASLSFTGAGGGYRIYKYGINNVTLSPVFNLMIAQTGVLATTEVKYSGVMLIPTTQPDKLLITNGSGLDTYTFSTNVLTSASQQVGIGWIPTSTANYGNYVAVVSYNNNANRCKLSLFNFSGAGTPTSADFNYEIDDTFVSAVKNWQGNLYIFTQGRNATTKIWKFEGRNVSGEPVWEGYTSQAGSAPAHSSIDTFFNQLFWASTVPSSSTTNSTTVNVYAYGSPRSKNVPVGTKIELRSYNIPATINQPTLCKNLKDSALYVGSSSSNGGVFNETSPVKFDYENWDTSTSNVVFASSNYFTYQYELPAKSTITEIKVYFGNFGLPYSRVNMQVYTNEDSNSAKSFLEVQGATTGAISYHPFPTTIPNVNQFFINVDQTNCVVDKIEVFYTVADKV